MPRITHFEVCVDDPARAQKFYSNVFGWEFNKWDGPNEYWMAKTDEDGQPGINGGLMRRMPGQPSGMINYIEVQSVDEFSKKIQSKGGKIIKPKTQIPGVGYFAMCNDTEENLFAIIQLDMK